MTKKITLVFVLFLFVFGLRAESLLNEGFEGWSTTNFPTGGWTVINDTQEGAINHWTVDNSKSACAGSVSLYCNGGEWDPIEPVKEEWIVSPSLTLSETNYNLSFLWKGASASAFKNEYDLQGETEEERKVLEYLKKYKLASSEGVNKLSNRMIRFEVLKKILLQFDSIESKVFELIKQRMEELVE